MKLIIDNNCQITNICIQFRVKNVINVYLFIAIAINPYKDWKINKIKCIKYNLIIYNIMW